MLRYPTTLNTLLDIVFSFFSLHFFCVSTAHSPTYMSNLRQKVERPVNYIFDFFFFTKKEGNVAFLVHNLITKIKKSEITFSFCKVSKTNLVSLGRRP